MNVSSVWHRYTNELVGGIVLVCAGLFVAAGLHAGLLKDWFTPAVKLRLLLPEGGTGGLSVGASVEILGTNAGTVRRIVIDPKRQIYAEVTLDDQMRVFVHRDSKATIKRRFGVAGDAYVEISRGTGEELDWEFAVLSATSDRAPTDTIDQVLDEVRQRILPLLEDGGKAVQAFGAVATRLQDPNGPFERVMGSLASISGRIDRGEGLAGRILSDEELGRELAAAVTDMRHMIGDANHLVDELNRVTGDARLQDLMKRTETVLASLQVATANLARASVQFPQVTQNVNAVTGSLPALLLQAQMSARELELLLSQLRGNWLLGGGGQPPPAARRLPASEVRP